MGDNLLQGGSLSFEAECPGGSLLRSNLPRRHFTLGGKLLRDSPDTELPEQWKRYFHNVPAT